MIYKKIYHIKRADENDLPAVKHLIQKIYNKKISLNYLKSKYKTSYLNINYMCSVAYCNNAPVAFYGAIPQLFKNKDHEIYIAQACDSLTLPNHQRKGLNYELAKFTYQIMRNYDIKLVYGFLSENSYYSTKKLDWKEHQSLSRFHIKTKTIPFSKILYKLNLSSVYQLFFNKKVSSESLKKLASIQENKYSLKFTQEFIKYKNSFNNHYSVKIDNCFFWIKIETIAHVGLFYAPNKLEFKKAIQKFKLKLFLLGINEIIFHVDSKSNMQEQLQNIATPQESWLVGFFSFKEINNLNEFNFSYSDFDNF